MKAQEREAILNFESPEIKPQGRYPVFQVFSEPPSNNVIAQINGKE